MTIKRRGRGRPRKALAPTGASARETAAEIGITRSRLLRYVEEGCPSRLHNERRFFDVDAVRAWIDGRSDEEPAIPSAKILHPTDPRYRASVASGKIRQRKAEVEAGIYVSLGQAMPRAFAAFDALQHGLRLLPSMVFEQNLTPDTAADILSPLVEDILENHFPLHAGMWPLPVVMDEPESEEPSEPGSEFDMQHDYVPVLQAGDPRTIEATAKAKAMEAELAELMTSTVYTEDFRLIVDAIADETRQVVRVLPSLVADALTGDSTDVRELIEDKSDLVRLLIRGANEDTSEAVVQALADVTGGRPYSVFERVQAVTILPNAPAGAEFDLPELADMDAILAVLKHWPNIKNKRAESIFG